MFTPNANAVAGARAVVDAALGDVTSTAPGEGGFRRDKCRGREARLFDGEELPGVSADAYKPEGTAATGCEGAENPVSLNAEVTVGEVAVVKAVVVSHGGEGDFGSGSSSDTELI